MRDADTALQRAKALGKGRYEIFDSVMHREVMARLRLEADLRHVVEHVQPAMILQFDHERTRRPLEQHGRAPGTEGRVAIKFVIDRSGAVIKRKTRGMEYGVVVLADEYYGYGSTVIIDHGGIQTLYAHLSSFDVSEGQQISQGKIVGRVGCTGSCTGDHLHFEVRVNGSPVDPLNYLP